MTDKRILLVEDNPDDIELTMRALDKNNIMNEVVVARDGVEAVHYLLGTGNFEGRDKTEIPMLVLLDLNLPRLDGIEVLKQLRGNEATKMVPVVILTSSKEERDLVNGYSLGCNSYIIKPVDFAQFSEVVRQIGLYWLLLNVPPPV
jgi:two-component system response regulator